MSRQCAATAWRGGCRWPRTRSTERTTERTAAARQTGTERLRERAWHRAAAGLNDHNARKGGESRSSGSNSGVGFVTVPQSGCKESTEESKQVGGDSTPPPHTRLKPLRRKGQACGAPCTEGAARPGQHLTVRSVSARKAERRKKAEPVWGRFPCRPPSSKSRHGHDLSRLQAGGAGEGARRRMEESTSPSMRPAPPRTPAPATRFQ